MTGDLPAWLAWLRIPDCRCPWTRDPTPARPQGWKRGHAHPDCRWHGSAKPEGFYLMAEGVSPGPRLDMFARRTRMGWDAWGDQAPGPVDLEALRA